MDLGHRQSADAIGNSAIRPRGPHFTMRTMMVAVALVGLLLAAWKEVPILFARHTEYSSLARMWAHSERHEIGFIRDVPYTLRELKDTPENREYRATLEERLCHSRLCVPYLHAMRLKYERAARFPWLDVAPDPPGPSRAGLR